MPDSSFTAINKPAGEFDFTNDGARPTGAEGWLVMRAAARDRQAQDRLPGKPAGFHAGHLIPARYGGPGDTRNLVPMPGVKNTSFVSAVENAVGRVLKFGDVYLRVTVEYTGAGKLPSTVRHEMFQRIDGIMRPVVGGNVVTNLADGSDARMSDAQDQYTGKQLAPKHFLDGNDRRGMSPAGLH
jgi:hypothetical protein